ncbi:tetratricopeptide repeat protein [Burkholderia sp. Ed8]|uniref:tetratricopeptide repeat protein n=1 Tax=Burkholderia sp. Ed8 TaxID=3112957 RepID=UPI00345CFD36
MAARSSVGTSSDELSRVFELASKGLGVPVDAALAEDWLHKGAETGDSSALIDLGTLYALGTGGHKVDGERAASFYRQAADAGLPSGWNALGWMYLNGNGVAKDAMTAFGWYLKAARAGFTPAQVMVGRLYLAGRGVAKDGATGKGWMLRAAEAGDTDAQTWLGRFYLWGTPPFERNESQGLRWLTMAACAGNSDGQFWLADAYVNGRKVTADPVRGYAWMSVAARQGNGSAKSNLDGIKFMLSHDQIERGAAAAARWQVDQDVVVSPEQPGSMATKQFNLNAPFAPGD